MKRPAHRILLLQVVRNPHSVDFSDELIQLLQAKKSSEQPFFVLDNHSEGTTVHLAKKLIEDSENLLVIVEVKEEATLGPLQGLLHSLLKQENVTLCVKGHHPQVIPFIQLLKGSYFERAEELIAHFE